MENFSVSRGTIYETYESTDWIAWKDALWEARRWVEEYPDEEVIIYNEYGEPVKAWRYGEEVTI